MPLNRVATLDELVVPNMSVAGYPVEKIKKSPEKQNLRQLLWSRPWTALIFHTFYPKLLTRQRRPRLPSIGQIVPWPSLSSKRSRTSRITDGLQKLAWATPSMRPSARDQFPGQGDGQTSSTF